MKCETMNGLIEYTCDRVHIEHEITHAITLAILQIGRAALIIEAVG
jgi:hypothetical protein